MFEHASTRFRIFNIIFIRFGATAKNGCHSDIVTMDIMTNCCDISLRQLSMMAPLCCSYDGCIEILSDTWEDFIGIINDI